MRPLVVTVVVLALGSLPAACNIPSADDYKNKQPNTEPPPKTTPPPQEVVEGFVITHVTPTTVPPKGQELIEIRGGGFEEGALAYFGASQALDTLVNSDTRIFATAPPHHASLVDIRVVNPDNTEALLKNGFRYASKIIIKEVEPATGPTDGGIAIELHGTGFWGTDTVLVGGRMALNVTVAADHTILAVLPPGNSGTADIHVLSSSQTGRLQDAFLYEKGEPIPSDSSLKIESMTPTAGPSVGGTDFSVVGSGFDGDHVEVFLGALPAVSINVAHGGLLTAVTPAGSPGLADLRVIVDGHQARLENAFTFLFGKVQLLAVSPSQGAIAGNTWVTLYGTDFPTHPEVFFGENGAKWLERLSPTSIAVKSARAEEIGTVDIRLTGPSGLSITLPQSYTYFDPTARWGGTFGGPIEGSINATVLDAYTNDPIDEAMVIVGHEHPPTLLGYSDERGQVTLSSQHLAGRQMVTAAKPGYSASTIVDMNAKNVTFFLFGPAPPPSNGGGGGGSPFAPGNIDGSVHLNGKYMVLPPAQCSAMGAVESGHCTPCQTDLDCPEGASLCATLTDQDPFCTSECLVNADCPEDYECQKSATDAANRCVPTKGTAQVRCFVSSTSLFSSPPAATVDNTVEISAGKSTFELKNIRLGDVAIYCLGGSRRVIGGVASFAAYVMGIQRHVFVTPGKDLSKKGAPELPPVQVVVSLDIPLTRSIETVVDERPLHPDGPHRTEIKAWLMLGSDGIIPLDSQDLPNDKHDYRFVGLPHSLSGQLYDAKYAFYAGALSKTADYMPTSETLRVDLPALENGRYLRAEGELFSVKESGYPGDVLGLHVLGPASAMAATESGSVIHYNGQGWYAQPVQRGPALRGIDGDFAGGIVAVGDKGRVLRWNGVGWKPQTSGTQKNLRAVVSLGKANAVAVGQYVILNWDGQTWIEEPYGPPKDLHSVWGLPSMDLFAVGEDGVVIKRDPQSLKWSAVNVSFLSTLRSVFGTANGFVIAVGDNGGCLIKKGDQEFSVQEVPTKQHLRDVWGRSDTDIYAVGDRATVLHFNGSEWSIISENTIESSLRSIHGSQPGKELLLAMGTQSINLGPFVGVARFESPTFGKIWDGHSLTWAIQPTGGGEPTFQTFRMYNASNALFWSIIAPQWIQNFTLPDLAATAGVTMPKAIKRLTSHRVLHSGFKIDEFDIRIYRLSDWRAWSISGFLFDNPSSVPKEPSEGM